LFDRGEIEPIAGKKAYVYKERKNSEVSYSMSN